MFKNISPEAMNKIIATMELTYASQDEDLVTQGDAAYDWMCIIKGTAVVLQNGNELCKFGPLSMLGEAALVTDDEIHFRGATVRVTSKTCTCLVLHRNDYVRLLKSGILDQSAHEHAEKIARQHSEKDTARNVTSLMIKRSRTKVAPTLLARKQMKENSAENLRKIRKQFGAGSKEYTKAAIKSQMAAIL
jgi:CRP-like cAMP-binding protein